MGRNNNNNKTLTNTTSTNDLNPLLWINIHTHTHTKSTGRHKVCSFGHKFGQYFFFFSACLPLLPSD